MGKVQVKEVVVKDTTHQDACHGGCQAKKDGFEASLLAHLGFEARVVQAFQNRFPDGSVGSHAWVSATVGHETCYLDSLFYDAQAGEITFTPLSKVTGITPVFKLFTWWGATAVNAHRYYVTGKDG